MKFDIMIFRVFKFYGVDFARSRPLKYFKYFFIWNERIQFPKRNSRMSCFQEEENDVAARYDFFFFCISFIVK